MDVHEWYVLYTVYGVFYSLYFNRTFAYETYYYVYHIDVNPIEVYPIEAYPIGEGAVEVSGCSLVYVL